MKKVIVLVITALLVFCFAAQCESGEYDFSSMSVEELSGMINEAQAQLKVKLLEAANMPDSEFMATLSNLPVAVVGARCVVQSTEYKSLYPDYLQAIITNNSQDDIRDLVVAFAAWDENGMPVKLRGQYDFGSAEYIQVVTFKDANVIPGATYGDNAGYKLAASCNVATVRAMAASYTGLNNQVWNNPYYESFVRKYSGRKLDEAIG